MKAIVWTAYGPPEVLQMQEVEKPAPRDNEVLIKIRATTVATADCELRRFKASGAFWIPLRIYIGPLRPTRIRILGQEVAGDIEAAGKDVTRFKVGDPVFGATDIRLSTYAEYVCLPETAMMASKPANLSYEEAAAVPIGGPEAWQYLNGNVKPGQQVMVIGAGGTIGTYGVQLAKYYGAEVTAVDSADKFDMLRSIGADHLVDYTAGDYTKGGPVYDVIFDAPGKSSYAGCRALLKPDGQYLSANPGLGEQMRTAFSLVTNPRRRMSDYANDRRQGLVVLKELIEAGKIKPVVDDRHFTLAQAADAHRYAETGRKKGNIVMTVA